MGRFSEFSDEQLDILEVGIKLARNYLPYQDEANKLFTDVVQELDYRHSQAYKDLKLISKKLPLEQVEITHCEDWEQTDEFGRTYYVPIFFVRHTLIDLEYFYWVDKTGNVLHSQTNPYLDSIS